MTSRLTPKVTAAMFHSDHLGAGTRLGAALARIGLPRGSPSAKIRHVRALMDAPFLDWFGPEVEADPERFYGDLRQSTSVVRNPLGAVVIRREAAHSVLGDPRLISSILHLVRAQGVTEGRLHDMISSSVIAVDGSDHARLRRLVSRSFTPRAAAQHRPAMRALVDELIDGFAGRGRCEFVADFADHYPVQVICEVLGVPREDHEAFARWGDALVFALSLELGAHRQEVEQASEALGEYVGRLVDDRRARPRRPRGCGRRRLVHPCGHAGVRLRCLGQPR